MSNEFNITNVHVVKNSSVLKESKVKAYVSITINDAFVVGDIRVIEGSNGLFVAFPSRLPKNGGKRISTSYPIRKEIREQTIKDILKAYNNGDTGYPEAAKQQATDENNVPNEAPEI